MKKSRRWKRFTHEQIRAKAEQRRDLKCYRSLLMEAAVEKDERGVVFDSYHPSWRKLIALVTTKSNEKEKQFLEELKKPRPDMYTIKAHCKANGIPKEARGRVWTLLLEEAAAASHCGTPRGDFSKLLPSDDPGLRVIKADVSRTFPYVPLFQKPEVQRELETLLSTYCREYGVQYKQGMNFIFAIFFQLGLPDSASRYHSACLFMETMTGGTFKDSDFGGLQSVFRVFRLLLLYHDPVMCNYLDQYDMVPELYASSWFITLHANRLPVDTLMRLWDHLLLDRLEHRLLHLFVSLGLLIKRRESLLNEGVVTLPEKLSRIAISSLGEVEELVGLARRKYRPDTPQSVRTQLLSIALRPASITSPEYLHLESMHCLMVSAEEVVASCFDDRKRRHADPLSPTTKGGGRSSLKKDAVKADGGIAGPGFGSVKYFVLDCRPEEEYRNGHLACAYHLDPELLFQPERLHQTARALAAMRGCHFCLCSDKAPPSRNDSPCTMLVLFLLQKGFKFISRLEGGYAACHAAIARRTRRRQNAKSGKGSKASSSSQGFGGFELLVDHDPAGCVECRLEAMRAGGRRLKGGMLGPSVGEGSGGGRFFGMLQTRFSDMLFGGAPSSLSSLIGAEGKASAANETAGTSSPKQQGTTSPKSPGPILPAPARRAEAKAERAFRLALRSGRVRVLCGNTGRSRAVDVPPSFRVLLTTLRQSKTWNPCLAAAVDRIVGRLVDASIDLVGNGAVLAEGWEATTTAALIGAVLSERDSQVLEAALEPYGRVARGQLARFRPGGSAAKSEESTGGGFGDTLPLRVEADTVGHAVLLYVPDASGSTDLLHEAMEDLAARGTASCLLTFTISKATAGHLLMKYPGLKVVTMTQEGHKNLPLIRLQSLMTNSTRIDTSRSR